jgi:hypothetical protein
MATISQADNNAKKKKFSQGFSKFVKRWVKAYAGALVVNSTAVPIFASAVTLCLYLPSSLSLPLLPQLGANWSVVVYGFVLTCIVLILFSIPCSYSATPEGGNAYHCSPLKDYQSKLRARLMIREGHQPLTEQEEAGQEKAIQVRTLYNFFSSPLSLVSPRTRFSRASNNGLVNTQLF